MTMALAEGRYRTLNIANQSAVGAAAKINDCVAVRAGQLSLFRYDSQCEIKVSLASGAMHGPLENINRVYNHTHAHIDIHFTSSDFCMRV